MAKDNAEKSSPAAGSQNQIADQASTLHTGNDGAALVAALSLGVRVARARIETCTALLGNAEAALGARQEALANNALLNAEPLLYEAQTILNAATMLRRNVRASESVKT